MADGDAGRTSILVFVVQLVARAIGFLGLVYFARILPQSELGIYFLFYLVVQVASLVSSLGMGAALVQRVSSSDRPSAMYTASLLVIAVLTVLASLAFFLFRGPIGRYVGADVPLLLTLAVAGWLFADIQKRAVQGEDRVLMSNLLQPLEDVIRVGVGAALITSGLGAEGLIFGVIAAFAVTGFVGMAVNNLSLTWPSRTDFRSLFAISRYTMFFGPANFVYFWLDTFMIGLLLTRASVSSYEVAWQTTRVLIIPTNAIAQTIFPKVARWHSEDARGEIERIMPGVILFSLIIPLPGIVGLLVLGPEILAIVYRPGYVEAAVPIVVLGGFMAVESLHRAGSQILTGMDRADVPFRSRLVGVTLVVVLNVLLIPPYGIVGAAVATLSAKVADAALLWLPFARLLDVDVPVRSLLWQSCSAAVMGLVLFGAKTQIAVDSLPMLTALVLGGAALYWGLALLDPDIRNALFQYVPLSRLPGG